ncbi:MAG: Asp23/Gls24 family envelope stress response protein [Clostridia bacterium]|nr:Asp23/Gls24 family envelope stress response protein [Clostridia bacterium]
MDKILENESGKIKISENVMGQLAKRAIDTTDGDAWLSNEKGRLIDESITVFVSTTVYSQAVQFEVIDGMLFFTINIICTFGKSLNEVTSAIIKQLERDIPKVFDERLAQIKVIIRGIKSKEIAKREIVFTEEYAR